MRIFTESPDIIRHRSTSGNSRPSVMLSGRETDKCTMSRPALASSQALLVRLFVIATGTEGKIGTLIACRKRQRYVMLCEAELDGAIGALSKEERGLGQRTTRTLAVRPTILERTLLARRSSRSKMQIRRQNGYEDLNLFAWTGV